jgi:hypothetical protein
MPGTQRAKIRSFNQRDSHTHSPSYRAETAYFGTFNHECGKPATFIGTRADGFASGFCDACKTNGWEASRRTHWEKIKR